MIRIASMCAVAAFMLPAQDKPPQDVWGALRTLEGTWQGTGTGKPGASKSERRYEFVLGGRFLHVANKSTYAPQPRNPKGEVHEDWGMFSYDRARKRIVLRQFHVEGFVNQYVLESAVGNTLVFVTEAIENITAGWRARETYTIASPGEFVERFDLAAPGKEFETYSETRFRRGGPGASAPR